MRTIYLGKPKDTCPSCGGPQVIRQLGVTLGGKPLYGCSSSWHVRQMETCSTCGKEKIICCDDTKGGRYCAACCCCGCHGKKVWK